MTYKEYMEQYHHCFGHEGYKCGERMLLSLEKLLVELKDGGYACPDEVDGGVPVKMAIDQEDAIDAIEQQLYDHDFAGEDYEIPEVGKEFLRKCFQEYNEKYANYGNYCDTVTVEVPDEMKYELEDTREHMRPSEYIEAEALIKEIDGRIEFREWLLAKSDEVMRAKHQGAIMAYVTIKASIKELQMVGEKDLLQLQDESTEALEENLKNVKEAFCPRCGQRLIYQGVEDGDFI